MGLTKEHLKTNFERARETEAKYVFIAIVADGVEEVITIPKRSMDAKEAFYESAYDEQLKHVMNKSVFIRGLSFGDATELDVLL